MIDQDLLKILACPETKQKLEPADPATLDRVNAAVEASSLVNRGGQKVTARLDGGLIREDREYLYPVRDDIPVMLIEEAISLKNL